MTTTYSRQSHPGASLGAARVGEAMHRGVVTCRPGASLFTVARQYETHHLIVLGHGSERPVGIISTLDIPDAVAELPERNGAETG